MNDKNLLERLGIIQRVEIDESDESGKNASESANIAVQIEDPDDNFEVASELVPEADAFEIAESVNPSLRFVTSIKETVKDNNPAYNLHEEQQFNPDYLFDTETEINAGSVPSLSEIIEEPSTYQEPMITETISELTPESVSTTDSTTDSTTIPISDSEFNSVTDSVMDSLLDSVTDSVSDSVTDSMPDSMPYIPETVYEEPEEITLPVIDREAIYAQYAPEATIAAQQATENKQYLDTEKYSSISDLYKTYNKKLGGTDTIFIVDAFAKSLPDTLSINLKRQSVLNIIAASNINLEELVADGLSRIDNLNSFLSLFQQHTQQLTTAKEEQIAQLERQISALKREVKERNRLQEKQEAAIDFETQKIKTSLEFIANNDDFGE